MMKILWVSNAPFCTTGYGVQTKLFAPRLQQLGHEVAIASFFGLEGGIIDWGGIPIYPRGYHLYGQDIVGAHAKYTEADIVISLMDAWVCEPAWYGPHVRWVPWFPVDMAPLNPPVRDKVRLAYERIIYSEFAKEVMDEAGLPYHYIPHGVDTRIYRPRDRKASREQLGVSNDVFVIGMVAANKGFPSRKAFVQQLEAFALLAKKHTDVVLYLHTNKGPQQQGLNLPELCEALGLKIGKNVIFADQYALWGGYSDDLMATHYNAFNVLTSVSMGEGFGVPILEAQSCGIPVIVGDWTSMPELCAWGWKIPKEQARKTWTPMAAWQYDPEPAAIYEAYEHYYLLNEDEERNGRQVAYQFAQRYDVDTVTQQYWVPALELIGDRIAAEEDTSVWQPTVR